MLRVAVVASGWEGDETALSGTASRTVPGDLESLPDFTADTN